MNVFKWLVRPGSWTVSQKLSLAMLLTIGLSVLTGYGVAPAGGISFPDAVAATAYLVLGILMVLMTVRSFRR